MSKVGQLICEECGKRYKQPKGDSIVRLLLSAVAAANGAQGLVFEWCSPECKKISQAKKALDRDSSG